MKRKIFAILLSISFSAIALAGCGKTNAGESNSALSTPNSELVAEVTATPQVTVEPTMEPIVKETETPKETHTPEPATTEIPETTEEPKATEIPEESNNDVEDTTDDTSALSPTPSALPEATPTAVPTKAPVVTEAPKATATPAPTQLPIDNSPLPIETPVPTVAPTQTPVATATPQPQVTPQPTAIPAPVCEHAGLQLTGRVWKEEEWSVGRCHETLVYFETVCTQCGEKFEDPNPSGMNPTHPATENPGSYPATCTTDGYYAGAQCDCGQAKAEPYVLPAHGHRYEITQLENVFHHGEELYPDDPALAAQSGWTEYHYQEKCGWPSCGHIARDWWSLDATEAW